MSKQWKHDELANDLAAHLRGDGTKVVWTDMQIGPAGSPRPDVYTLNKSYSKFVPVAYECKISTSDFRRDITSGKWQSYLQFASAVVFAVPAGLVTKDDIPKGCGLIVRHDEIWRTAKGPTMQHLQTLLHSAWMKLVIDGLTRAAPRDPEPRKLYKWEAEKAIRKKYGDRIGGLLKDLNTAEMMLEYHIGEANKAASKAKEEAAQTMRYARESVERDLANVRQEREQFAAAIGLEPNASLWKIQERVEEMRSRLLEDGELKRIRDAITTIQRDFSNALAPIPSIARVAS